MQVQRAHCYTHALYHASNATHLRSCGSKHYDRPLSHEIKRSAVASVRLNVGDTKMRSQQ